MKCRRAHLALKEIAIDDPLPHVGSAQHAGQQLPPIARTASGIEASDSPTTDAAARYISTDRPRVRASPAADPGQPHRVAPCVGHIPPLDRRATGAPHHAAADHSALPGREAYGARGGDLPPATTLPTADCSRSGACGSYAPAEEAHLEADEESIPPARQLSDFQYMNISEVPFNSIEELDLCPRHQAAAQESRPHRVACR